MIDFTQMEEATYWQSTNDAVMGGMSQGKLKYKGQSCIFSGNISLENNGGFSSINRLIDKLNQDLDTVEIDVAGDGLIYQIRVATLVNGYRLAYKHDFETSQGQRKKIKFSLSHFKASFRGNLVEDAPALKSEDIRQVGFLLVNREQRHFSISLYSLAIYNQKENDLNSKLPK